MDDFSPVLHKYRLRKCFFHLLGAPFLVPRQFSDMSLHSILPQVSSVKSAAEVQIWYIEVSGFLENNLICAVCDVATIAFSDISHKHKLILVDTILYKLKTDDYCQINTVIHTVVLKAKHSQSEPTNIIFI